jgi:hypothetical protein
MFKAQAGFIGKGAISIVNIQKIAAQKIVGDIDVFPSIIINVSNSNTQGISIIVYACCGRNVGKIRVAQRVAAFVAVKLIRESLFVFPGTTVEPGAGPLGKCRCSEVYI